MSDKPIKDDENVAEKTTLADSDIVADHDGGRRLALQRIGATVLGAAATALGGCYVSAQPGVVTGPGVVASGVTDGDNGPRADPGGAGRGQPRSQPTGLTDGDNGRWTDAGGYGRGSGARVSSQPTYGQPGYAQPVYGAQPVYVAPGNTGYTDRDPGDGAGRGRGPGYTGLTDSDPSDGSGRGHRGNK